MNTALIATAIDLLRDRREPGKVMYLSFNGNDPSDEAMRWISTSLPDFAVRKMSERPGNEDSCSLPPGQISVGACRRDDFLDLKFAGAPFWRTFNLGATTAACDLKVTVVRVVEWSVLSKTGFCS
jgi:hypothetical protein